MKDDYPNEHGPFRFHFRSQLVTADREKCIPHAIKELDGCNCVGIAGATNLSDLILPDPNACNLGFLLK